MPADFDVLAGGDVTGTSVAAAIRADPTPSTVVEPAFRDAAN